MNIFSWKGKCLYQPGKAKIFSDTKGDELVVMYKTTIFEVFLVFLSKMSKNKKKKKI